MKFNGICPISLPITLVVWLETHTWPQCWAHQGQNQRKFAEMTISHLTNSTPIAKTPVRNIIWCPTTKMLIKARFLIQPLEQEGGCQKCYITLCSKVVMIHLYQVKAIPECLNILIYWNEYWVDRLRRTLRRKVERGIFYQQIYRLCHYILHQVAHINCSAPSGKQHERLTGVWGIVCWTTHLPSIMPHWIADKFFIYTYI